MPIEKPKFEYEVIHEHRQCDAEALEGVYCWYQWDPEMKTFRRGCEGN